MKKKKLFGAVLALLLLVSCTGRENGARPNADAEMPGFASPAASALGSIAWPAIALLRTGENPLWFELGPEGPALIESPSRASLTPYAPWPHARHITGMLLWEGLLVMTVNRDGFIVLRPVAEGADAVLYRVAGSGLWEPYTAESFFLWEDRPTALLYQNDFFTGPTSPRLGSQLFV